MRNLFIAFLFAFIAWTNAMANSAKPGFTSFLQSDGTHIDVQTVGDEFFSRYTTSDGLTIERNANGDWCYFTQNGISSIVAHNVNARTSEELEFIAAEKDDLSPSSQMSESTRRLIKKVNGMRIAGKVPHSGTIRIPVILVQFNDVKMKHTATEFRAQFNTNTKSVRQYFIDQSNGLFQPQFDVSGIYTLKSNRAVYGAHGTNNQGEAVNDVGRGMLVAEAIDLAQAAKAFTWSNYDNDGDSYCDVVVVIYAGVGESKTGGTVPDSLWPCQWSLSGTNRSGDGPGTKTFNGITIDDFAMLNEIKGGNESNTQMDGIGTFCHEFSHCISLPDFYDTDNTFAHYGMGNWSLMDYGDYADNGETPIGYSAFEKNWMGWIPLNTPKKNTRYTIPAMNQGSASTDVAYKIESSINSNEYFILENRRKQGWDKFLPAEGMLISHVTYDSYRWNNHALNTQDIQLMTIMPADNIVSDETESGDTWGSTQHDFTDSSNPAAKLYMTAKGDITGNAGFLRHPVTDIQINSSGTVSFWYEKTINKIEVGDIAYNIISEPTSSNYGTVEACGLSAAGAAKTSLALGIPMTVTYNSKTYTVVSVSDYAFQGKTNLTSVRTYPNVATIGKGAFKGCTGITYAQFSSYTEIIGEEAFAGCTSLKYVYSPKAIPPVISYNTFPSNPGMTLYVTRSDANSVTNYMQEGYRSIFTSIVKSKYSYDIFCSDGALLVITEKPNGTTIGKMSVVGFNANGSIVANGKFSPSCGSSYYMFSGSKFNITAIADSAFMNDTSLKDAELSNLKSLASIGEYAFYGSEVTGITVPASVTAIGNRAFVNCPKLKELILMQQSGTRSWTGQFYGGNASDFTCYVKWTSLYSYRNSVKNWSKLFNSTKEPIDQLNGYIAGGTENMAVSVLHPVDWNASGLSARYPYNYGDFKVYTKAVTSTALGEGVLLTGVGSNTLYKLKRPSGTPSSLSGNYLKGINGTNVNVYSANVGYYFNSSKKKFVRPTSSYVLYCGNAYLTLSSNFVGTSTKDIDIDLFPQELKGDVDGNGVVNVSDVTALINQILGTASYPTSRCDIDGNGVVNVSDVTALINLILAQ